MRIEFKNGSVIEFPNNVDSAIRGTRKKNIEIMIETQGKSNSSRNSK